MAHAHFGIRDWARIISRIHGDLHLGNVIWDVDTPHLIDFDDSGMGWVGQDLWLMAPGR